MRSTSWLVSTAVGLLGLLLVAAGVLLLALAWSSFAWAKALADGMAPDGNAEAFTEDFFARVRGSWSFVGGVLSAFGLVFGLLCRPVANLGRRIGADFSPLLAAWRNGLASFRHEIGSSHGAVFVLLLVAGLAVRAVFASRPLHLDETVTYLLLSKRPVLSIISDYSTVNNHILNTVLVHYACLFFGHEPWVIRLPCLVAGFLTVPAAYGCGRTLFGKHAALLAMGLVASTPILVDYSVNARGYSLLGLIFVVMFALAIHVARSRNLAASFLLGVMTAVGFLTLPSMVFGFGIVIWWLLLTFLGSLPRARNEVRAFGLSLVVMVATAGVLTFVLYTPALLRTGLEAFTHNETVAFTGVESTGFWHKLGVTLGSVWEQWRRDVPLAIVAALLGGWVVGLLVDERVRRTSLALLAAIPLAMLPIMAAQRLVPYDRVWLFLLPLFLIVTAGGLAACLERALAWAPRAALGFAPLVATGLAAGNITSLIVCETIQASTETVSFPNAQEVAQFLQGQLAPGDQVVVDLWEGFILRVYLERQGVSPQVLEPRPETARCLLIVNQMTKRTEERLELLLQDLQRQYPSQAWTFPRQFKSFSHAEVYEVRRASKQEPPHRP